MDAKKTKLLTLVFGIGAGLAVAGIAGGVFASIQEARSLPDPSDVVLPATLPDTGASAE